MTMNDTWGYKSYDNNWKGVDTLVRNLVDIASKGGNYLLNVGPKPDGTIPDASIERLHAVGRWMKVNGQAIYGTSASPTRLPAWGRITTKTAGGKTVLYLHVFDWPADGKLPVAVTNEVVSCELLADANRKFDATRQDDGLIVNLAGKAPDPICSVVALTIKGEPKAVVYRTAQQADGRLVLAAVDADLHGALQIEAKDDKPNIGYWVNSDDWVEWNVRIQQPAEFKVVADVALIGDGGLVVQFGKQELTPKLASTGDYAKFQTIELGKIRIDQAGEGSLIVRACKPAWSPVNIRSITLQPVR